MTFNTILDLPTFSRPRCMCHNLYIEKCPTNADIVERKVERNTTLLKPFISEPKRCKKHGHKSRGKAEAQLRSLIRRQLASTPKGDLPEVYKCRRVECRNHPWHVGHNPYVRREV